MKVFSFASYHLPVEMLTVVTMVSFFFFWSLGKFNGQLIYPLDDTYIHLQISDNLVENSTWGINANEFASASSSIIYTLLLSSIGFLIGSHIITPLVINVIFALLLIVCFEELYKNTIEKNRRVLAVLCIFLLLPIGPIIVSGMEHTVQLLINLFFFVTSIRFLKSEVYRLNRNFWLMALFGFLSVGIRFEGLFLAIVPCIFLLISFRIKELLILSFFFLLPVLLFGTYSVINDGSILPNSLLIKGEHPELTYEGVVFFIQKAIEKFAAAPHIAILMSTTIGWLAICLINRCSLKSELVLELITCIVVTSVHLLFAKTGWFYRYEAYLMLFFIIVFTTRFSPKALFVKNSVYFKWTLIPFLVFGLMILMFRGVRAYYRIPIATKNINDQQIQMAGFLSQSYGQSRVMANDIGAISYFNEIELIDIFGLADSEIAKLKYNRNYGMHDIERKAKEKSVELAIIYDDWFPGMVPPAWTKVAEWKISNNYICGSDVVSFYSIDKSHAKSLRNNLIKFAASLPEDVERFYLRLDGD